MDILSRPAEEFENDQSIEAMWAMKAFEHAEVHFNLLCSVDPQSLQLSPQDELVYKVFREQFHDLKIDVLNEDDLKSSKAKEKWRQFCEQFKNIIEDYSFGTLLRLDASDDYSEKNSILVTKIQFLAIEIARNKEGINNNLRKRFKSSSKKKELN
ncbi:unnamed protein product [Acanthoscelides obtectus]|uniref:Polysaccharide biosynthesis domain-containing protein n=1 Tax=Acanthoscelides obtectus TaxID=200917 RepID=A0A9P0JUY1_ACAOB|nr:unnamed protein product [Acanthoscelides obtectus]CAK1667274.1 Protein PBDC1 [Acanthoscelides obtectus]